jgi:hypothetical protein
MTLVMAPLVATIRPTPWHSWELLDNWRLARLGKPLARIAPLE